MKYEAVIGLEVHVQLNTNSKMFCSCSINFGEEPNSLTCPVCLGLPGALPKVNEKAIEFAIKSAIATNCEINKFSKFDRKNYFYPDLPKNYQISQYDKPLGVNGHIDFDVNGEKKRVRIRRVHLEEDAGKLVHVGYSGQIGGAESSLVDLNRCGLPLLEIVTEPDLHTSNEASDFLVALRNIVRYLGISDCNMEEGSLRCDANISVKTAKNSQAGAKTEIKNLNSFKHVREALEFESKRHIDMIEKGEPLVMETRLWDAKSRITVSMRTKEETSDYRYFPDPDLVPVITASEEIEAIKNKMLELPYDKKCRFVKEYGLSEYDTNVLTSSKELADYYEECVKIYNSPKSLCNWITVNLMAILKEQEISIEASHVKAGNMSELVKFVDEGSVSGLAAKEILDVMVKTGKNAKEIVEEKKLFQITDDGELEKIAKEVIVEFQKSVEDYKNGKEQALSFLVGQVMKKSKGKANPVKANKLLKEELAK